MNIHYLQHVEFETPAGIINWARKRGHSLTATRLYMGEELPIMDDIDLVVVMGGSMGVYNTDKYPFLKMEKEFIYRAIRDKKLLLGICLGAQLIADVMGARVYKNKYKEIGWFDVWLTDEGMDSHFFSGIEPVFKAFHWHGDTFDIPAGTMRIAQSEACENQGFAGDNVIALQFHLESTYSSIKMLIENAGHEIVNDKYIQDAKTMLNSDYIYNISRVLEIFMSNIENYIKQEEI